MAREAPMTKGALMARSVVITLRVMVFASHAA